eukprot:TRINITY_DN19126_c0_g1_i1.p1 TRINITY_DN19126_c0_g1~~TRINITY_DN19126_c0_g1_i1.p1  ORF type:complete len:517 (-),score=48.52 TRINITY_DN19126_c0_g1_i1:825-2375(-)
MDRNPVEIQAEERVLASLCIFQHIKQPEHTKTFHLYKERCKITLEGFEFLLMASGVILISESAGEQFNTMAMAADRLLVIQSFLKDGKWRLIFEYKHSRGVKGSLPESLQPSMNANLHRIPVLAADLAIMEGVTRNQKAHDPTSESNQEHQSLFDLDNSDSRMDEHYSRQQANSNSARQATHEFGGAGHRHGERIRQATLDADTLEGPDWEQHDALPSSSRRPSGQDYGLSSSDAQGNGPGLLSEFSDARNPFGSVPYDLPQVDTPSRSVQFAPPSQFTHAVEVKPRTPQIFQRPQRFISKNPSSLFTLRQGSPKRKSPLSRPTNRGNQGTIAELEDFFPSNESIHPLDPPLVSSPPFLTPPLPLSNTSNRVVEDWQHPQISAEYQPTNSPLNAAAPVSLVPHEGPPFNTAYMSCTNDSMSAPSHASIPAPVTSIAGINASRRATEAWGSQERTLSTSHPTATLSLPNFPAPHVSTAQVRQWSASQSSDETYRRSLDHASSNEPLQAARNKMQRLD